MLKHRRCTRGQGMEFPTVNSADAGGTSEGIGFVAPRSRRTHSPWRISGRSIPKTLHWWELCGVDAKMFQHRWQGSARRTGPVNRLLKLC